MADEDFLERTDQLFRQHFGLFGRVPRSGPISGLRSFPRLGDKTADFRRQVQLRSVKSLTSRRSDIFFRNAQTVSGLLLSRGGFFGREFRNNLQRFGLGGVACCTGWDCHSRSCRRRARLVQRTRGRGYVQFHRWHQIVIFVDGRKRQRDQLRSRAGSRTPREFPRLNLFLLRTSVHPNRTDAKRAHPSKEENSTTACTRWCGILAHGHAASGSSMRNVVPRPTSDVKSIEPL